MHTATQVLIKVGASWSLVGSAILEEDATTGTRLLHLRMAAMAPDVYVVLTDGSAPGQLLCADDAVLRDAQVLGHA